MRKTMRSLLAVTCAAAALAAAGCGTTSENSGQVQQQDPTKNCKGPDGKYTIGMSQANLAEPYRVRMDEDIRTAASKVPQFDVQFSDAAKDNSKQISDVENFITKQVDLLMISPNEAAPLTDVVKKAYNKGIPVVVLDRKVDGDGYTTYIGADNVQIGRQAGEYFTKTLLPQGGKIVQIKGLSGSTPAKEREDGFKEGIAGSNIEIVATADGEWERSVGQQKMDALLKAHPDIQAVYAQNDPMAEGAYLAAQAAGRNDLKFVGIDGLPIPSGGIKAVEEGRLQATNLYPTGGAEAVEAARALLIDCQPVPKTQTLQTELVTKDNAAEVYARLNQS
ncbi:ribose transport system substrate-binding protein [Saccharopolyspora antimicrobica]|uniref:Monosaccharide ABC transporter substrate-binding protein (CUT2 family) n=1 Tax=Saccharopolyspora antimicrobica TaxID=455193 RepID=A0A1I4ZW59_9PSEU|nr:substrate-binding domain-containing protein [Saccharopolyspora antimicrobica]RKT83384.1 monosaccharide ABC transporter substrate-binding protein (CUT2 family) [Saccharopolyspora antimicrobica]SFN54219.1 ribose transport system substrate-binding protein [Saccharopolyspora antimicrobica]